MKALLHKYFLAYIFLIFSIGSIAQKVQDVVYLKNGAIHHGEILTVSPDALLLKQGEEVISIDPELILEIGQKEVTTSKKEVVIEKDESKKERKPLDRRVLVEMRSGIALIDPLGLDVSMGTLTRLSDRHHLGVNLGMMLTKRSVFSAFGEYRFYVSKPGFTRLYFSLRPGIAYNPFEARVFSPDFNQYEYDSTPIKFMGIQSGWLLDSGYGIALSLNAGLNYIWFTETEIDLYSDYSITSDYQLVRPQVSMSLIF